MVLDASAVLAVLFEEPGAERVRQATLTPTPISAVNLSEVLGKMIERGASDIDARTRVAGLQLDVRSFGEISAHEAAFLRRVTRTAGLSLGDRACLTLARELGMPALTAERNWTRLDVGVSIELIR